MTDRTPKLIDTARLATRFERAVAAVRRKPETARATEHTTARLLPGGRCGIAVWGERNACGWRDIFPIVAARVKSEVCPMFFQLGTGANLVRLMEKCGFDNLRQETIEATLRYPDDESALIAVFEGGPVALAYSKFDDVTRANARSEYLESIAPYKTDHGYAIPGRFVIATGHKPAP